MKTKKQISTILSRIAEEFPDIRTELRYETSFQFLIAVILSAQTTDRQVNRITPPLFVRVREPRDVIDIPLAEIERAVSSVNFFRNKARFIKESGEIIAREYAGVIPNDLQILQTLP